MYEYETEIECKSECKIMHIRVSKKSVKVDAKLCESVFGNIHWKFPMDYFKPVFIFFTHMKYYYETAPHHL